jgi:hypothetical protein
MEHFICQTEKDISHLRICSVFFQRVYAEELSVTALLRNLWSLRKFTHSCPIPETCDPKKAQGIRSIISMEFQHLRTPASENSAMQKVPTGGLLVPMVPIGINFGLGPYTEQQSLLF